MDVDDETREIGYEEDGVFWITASSSVLDAEAAEKHMQAPWRVVQEVHLAPTGLRLNHKDEQWAECAPDHPGARRGWRLVHTGSPEIFEDGQWKANPYYRPPAHD